MYTVPSCLQPGDASTWNKLTAAKNLALNSWSSSSNLGVKVAATRFVQRVIQTQTRASVDPRVSDLSLLCASKPSSICIPFFLYSWPECLQTLTSASVHLLTRI